MEVASTVSEIYRLMLFSMQRGLSRREQQRMAAVLVDVVNQQVPLEAMTEGTAEAVELQAEGRVRLERLLSAEQAHAVRGHFLSRPCFNAHVPSVADGTARKVGEGAEAFHYGCYALSDILAAPHLLEIATSPLLLGAAQHYLGCTPTLYSMNAWWSFAGKSENAVYSQSFHRDTDDYRFCTLFCYLTDVDENGGPHLFVRRTQREDLVTAYLEDRRRQGRLASEEHQRLLSGLIFDNASAGYGSDPVIEDHFGDLIETILGPAGTGFLADTSAFHKGLRPRSRDRLIFWARYGLYTNMGPLSPPVSWSSVSHRLMPTDRLRYICRQILVD
jgi:hypothetical protein